MPGSVAKVSQFIKCIIFMELINIETRVRALLFFSGIY
jgi:hypothetical protein